MPENKETVVKLEDTGTLHIAEDVVVSIAALAAVEVEGVAALTSAQGTADIKKAYSRGVKISTDAQTVSIDISLLARYGFPIMSVAEKVQERVKSSVETMTGICPGAVNVHVLGIAFDKEGKK